VRSRGGVILVAAVVVIGVLFALLTRDTTPSPLGSGQAAPAFDLPRLSDDTHVRLGDLRGRVVLLNFWATWCKPCEDEMPSMERLHAKLKGQPFELLAVSVDEGQDDVKSFRDRLGLTLPILLDPSKKAANAYQAFRFPETVLIDQNGVVAGRFIGPRSWDDETYVEKIRALIEKGGPG